MGKSKGGFLAYSMAASNESTLASEAASSPSQGADFTASSPHELFVLSMSSDPTRHSTMLSMAAGGGLLAAQSTPPSGAEELSGWMPRPAEFIASSPQERFVQSMSSDPTRHSTMLSMAAGGSCW